MVDNVAITAGTGTTIAADDIGAGVLAQRVKPVWGPDGTGNDIDIATGKPLPVQMRSATGLIPIGEPTDAKSTATDTTSASLISVNKQISASAQTIAANSGAALPVGANVIGKVGIDQTSDGTTNAVRLLAETTKVIGVVQGAAASGATASGNPLPTAGLAVSSETAVTAGQAAAFITDLARKLIVMPYANPENFVSGVITTAMTGTTTTAVTGMGAPGAGLRNYITQLTVSNSHATVGTDIVLQDGSGGATFYTIPAAAVYGGATISFPTPLKQPTLNTALFAANVTTGASTKVSASGYKGA